MVEIDVFENSCTVKRSTKETSIILRLSCTAQKSVFTGSTGIGFFDHLLETLSKYCGLSIEITEFHADTHVDLHHAVEDTAIVIGTAIKNLFDYNLTARFGYCIVPMDDALIMSAIDLSGRQYLEFNVDFTVPNIGNFATELLEEFFKAFVNSSATTLHIRKLNGKNNHHVAECVFKSFGLCLNMALKPSNTTLSTKGVIM